MKVYLVMYLYMLTQVHTHTLAQHAHASGIYYAHAYTHMYVCIYAHKLTHTDNIACCMLYAVRTSKHVHVRVSDGF